MFMELEPVFNNLGFSLSIDYELDLSGLTVGGQAIFARPVRVSGAARNRSGIVEIAAEARLSISLRCDRCDVNFERELAIPIEHTVVTQLNHEENDDDYVLISSYRFDVDPLVSEDIQLALPAKLLCDENCKGLCPNCGQNLNEAACICKTPTDPRLDILKQLLDTES